MKNPPVLYSLVRSSPDASGATMPALTLLGNKANNTLSNVSNNL